MRIHRVVFIQWLTNIVSSSGFDLRLLSPILFGGLHQKHLHEIITTFLESYTPNLLFYTFLTCRLIILRLGLLPSISTSMHVNQKYLLFIIMHFRLKQTPPSISPTSRTSYHGSHFIIVTNRWGKTCCYLVLKRVVVYYVLIMWLLSGSCTISVSNYVYNFLFIKLSLWLTWLPLTPSFNPLCPFWFRWSDKFNIR